MAYKRKMDKTKYRGYEDIAEYVASLILKSSTLDPSEYVLYEPCEIQFDNGQVTKGCYSLDFRGTEQQEVSIERLFETHFESTSDILENTKLITKEKIEQGGRKGINSNYEVRYYASSNKDISI